MLNLQENAKDLQQAHAQLDRAVVELHKKLKGEATAELLLEVFEHIERGVRHHLAREEVSLLPRYRHEDLSDADEIERQHDNLRRIMRRCREALLEGTAPRSELQAFLESYRGHQLHEDTTMYRWARSISDDEA